MTEEFPIEFDDDHDPISVVITPVKIPTHFPEEDEDGNVVDDGVETLYVMVVSRYGEEPADIWSTVLRLVKKQRMSVEDWWKFVEDNDIDNASYLIAAGDGIISMIDKKVYAGIWNPQGHYDVYEFEEVSEA